ncbi:Detected protein of confused Function [Hibiscus syriacus]|uniref:Detected protein of confused Function n=1 Tax=Hibiscus syriacus TaxID=106335 RepID=A0A6A3CMA0_HIBSY|nr:Detected protein of confused Function [Hibiscus syriacus]
MRWWLQLTLVLRSIDHWWSSLNSGVMKWGKATRDSQFKFFWVLGFRKAVVLSKLRPQLIKPLNLRAFSSIPSCEYSNQSRGALPRFFSETLPSSKELGASSITPLLTKRSSTISDNRVERLQRVILAALDFTYVYDNQVERLQRVILDVWLGYNISWCYVFFLAFTRY